MLSVHDKSKYNSCHCGITALRRSFERSLQDHTYHPRHARHQGRDHAGRFAGGTEGRYLVRVNAEALRPREEWLGEEEHQVEVGSGRVVERNIEGGEPWMGRRMGVKVSNHAAGSWLSVPIEGRVGVPYSPNCRPIPPSSRGVYAEFDLRDISGAQVRQGRPSQMAPQDSPNRRRDLIEVGLRAFEPRDRWEV